MKKSIFILGLIIVFLGVSISAFTINLIQKPETATTTSKDLNLTIEEREWLKDHPVIKVGSDPNWAPFEYLDKDGNFCGIDIDYLKLVEEKTGIQFTFAQEKTWNDVLSKVKSKDIDLLSGINETTKRLEFLNFTKPYITNPISIFANEEITHIRSLSELNNEKVVVVKGYFTEYILKTYYPKIELILANSPQEALKTLHKKKVAAYIEGMINASFYLKETNYKSIRLVGETPYEYKIGFGVRNDWPELISILQKVLDSVSEKEKNNIYYKWISLSVSKEFDYSLLFKFTIPLIILLLIFIFWNRSLKREMIKKEQAQLDLNFAYKELKDTQTQLVQNEKMATVGQITAGIAHEIKNPLNYISLGINGVKDGFESIIQVINRYEELSKKLSDSDLTEIEELKQEVEYQFYKKECISIIEDINTGLKSIGEITKSLNTFSYFSGREKALADINDGIKSTLVLLKSQYKNKAEIVASFGNIPKIKCFPGKLNQVYVNLISNATQAIDDQGTITIKTFEENNQIVISIKDTGKGMTKDEMSQIFNPFYTSKPIGKGTGLGLSITKNIIDEHNGEIEFHSEKGKGTEFIIRLPIFT